MPTPSLHVADASFSPTDGEFVERR